MTEEPSEQVEHVYHEARQRDPRERAAFLEQACAGDSALRREVESLLEEDSNVRSFLETPALDFVEKTSGQDTSQSLVGRQLGSYFILSFLAKGGMGQVYRARDTKLKREVAIKILPEEFSRDRDRVARFQREAEVLASVNHPNIAAIYALEEADSARFLVLEFVEGETLAERIERGRIPIEHALNIARNICEALEAAHDKGITHRDLKPANIKLTPDGKVKVLDFGLAKLVSHELSATTAPALSVAATGSGVILGTAAYMSPEQAQGQQVDRRTDVFAFGCVLYEMLTGTRAFEGKDTMEIVGRVLTAEPDWSRLPSQAPWLIQRLVRRALIKDMHQRLGDIRDARIEIEEALAGSTATPERRVAASSKMRDRLAWTITIALGVVLASVLYFNRARAPSLPEIRVDVNTPSTAEPLSFAISPDGRRLVFSALNEGKSQLWVRSLDSVAAQPLPGTDGALAPFWSADSRSVGFFAELKLKRIDILGGAPQVLANAPCACGGTWNKDGIILFGATLSGGLVKVPATGGGEPVRVTRVETGQSSHLFPQFLPDGRHFVYFVPSGPRQDVYVASLDGDPSKRLTSADAAPVVSPSGFLLFSRQRTLFAQAFDFKTLELSGNPFPVADQVAVDALFFVAGFSAASGTVAYRTGSFRRARQLAWLDRSGKTVSNVGAPDVSGLTEVELSPDEKRVAVYRGVDGNSDLWLMDTARGIPTRFTFDAAPDSRPLWSPDGYRIVFQSGRRPRGIYWKLSTGAGAEELLVESDQNAATTYAPNGWSSDGGFLLYRTIDPQTGYDLWVLPFSGDKKPFPFLKTPFDERDGQFSPDGKWIAYQSNETGRFEIYVQPFPRPGGKFLISANGGIQPRWSKNGKEIFYVSADSQMMAASVNSSPDGQSMETGTPAALFPVRIAYGAMSSTNNKQEYDVSSDGQRFLVNLDTYEDTTSPITLILNWSPQLKK